MNVSFRWGTLEQVKIFLSEQCNPNEWDENGRTAMHYAVLRENKDAIFILHALLAAGGNIFIQDSCEATVVDDALILDNKEALKVFIINCRLKILDPALREKYPVIDKVLAELLPVRCLPVMVRLVPFTLPC